MTAALEHATRRVGGLAPYSPGRGSADAPGKLSSNELFLGPSPRTRAAVAASAATVHRYHATEPLRGAVAEHVGVDTDRVVLTSGSDELCYLLATLAIAEGDRVVLADPAYRIDEIVSIVAGGVPHPVAVRDGVPDLAAMSAVAAGARLVWLATPHNPTGCAVDIDALDGLLATVPEDCLVVLDEAYRDFVAPALRPDSVALLARHPNLVVQRTLSKAYGLAGLRVGYGLAHPDLVSALNTIRPPFNVNSAALAGAIAALQDTAWRDYATELTRRGRERLQAFLAERRIAYWPSQANFVTVNTGGATPALLRALAAAGITVRDGADLGIPGRIRISIGAPTEMALVRAAFLDLQESG